MPDTSIHLYQLAALADPKYMPMVRQITSKSARAPQKWLPLLKQAGF